MSKQEIFRWRTNPAIIASYWLDRDVPKGAEVVLRPNEACVVIEDGRIIGVATQSKMEVNPEVGMLKKIFGGKSPTRSFLFVMLGPHDLLLAMNGVTSDGQTVKGVVGLKIDIEREDAARLLQLPAKGESSIRLGHLVSMLEPELNAVAVKEFMSQFSLAELRESPDVQEEVESSVKTALRSSLQNLGLRFSSCWAQWNQTEAEQILKMQQDRENAAARNAVIEQQQQDEMDSIFRNRTRKIELTHKLKVAQLTQAAREETADELAKIQAESELQAARWETVVNDWRRKQELREETAEAGRRMMLDTQRDSIELAKLRIEEQRLNQAAMGESQDEAMERQNRARLAEIKTEHIALSARLESARGQSQLEQEVKDVEFGRQEKALDSKAQRAAELFEGVQKAKRDRMALETEREDSRLERHGSMSDKVLGVLGDIAGSGDAGDEVKLEALRQLGQLRKTDVEGSGDAYIDSEDDKKKE